MGTFLRKKGTKIRRLCRGLSLFDDQKAAKSCKGKPTAIICNTVKGRGVSFMENSVGWHGKAPNKEQYEQAVAEIKASVAAL